MGRLSGWPLFPVTSRSPLSKSPPPSGTWPKLSHSCCLRCGRAYSDPALSRPRRLWITSSMPPVCLLAPEG
eukprot:7377823-Prymnesium_polylepis.1